LAALASRTGFSARFNALDRENKKISAALAESCIQQALLDLAAGTPVFPKIVPVGLNYCKICDISSGTSKTILTHASYKGAFSNFNVNVTDNDNGNFTINNWSEIASYSGPACDVPQYILEIGHSADLQNYIKKGRL